MRIRDILDRKGREVVTVEPDRTVLEAMRVLTSNNIGAVVIVRNRDILGIMTERDVLRLGAGDPEVLASTPVSEVMTRDLVVGVAEDAVDYAAGVMTENRIRHLPIVEANRLVGLVSIGDVVKAIKHEVEIENRYLRDYIQGVVW